ncbi:MAG: hypothetical protein J6Y42_00490 [Bacilli bacterium]|nr:hypothetical protein [Bacilli bacterium]
MEKKKIANAIYYASIIITIIAMIFVLFVICGESYTDEFISLVRYFVAYFCFATIISLGVVLRELILGNYNKKKMIIKFIVMGVALIIGVLATIFIRNVKIGLGLLFVSLFVLSYEIIPTVRNTKNEE